MNFVATHTAKLRIATAPSGGIGMPYRSAPSASR